MQTELKTVKDEKLVDLDVSGEGAEIELEDKSHGAVKPDKYEEVKTEEKDPLKPDVEVADEQSEEMDQYSDKVKKSFLMGLGVNKEIGSCLADTQDQE